MYLLVFINLNGLNMFIYTEALSFYVQIKNKFMLFIKFIYQWAIG